MSSGLWGFALVVITLAVIHAVDTHWLKAAGGFLILFTVIAMGLQILGIA